MASRSLLIVEDDESFCLALRTYLSTLYEVSEARNLRQARQILKKQSFDIVLLDKGLPDGSGLTLIESIRESSPKSVVIVMTEDTDFSSATRGIASGADDYVVKTEHSVPDLLVRIPAAIQQKSVLNENQFALPLPSKINQLSNASYHQFVESAEKRFLEVALNLCGFQVAEVAERLGLARATVFKKISELEIKRNTESRSLEEDF